VNTRLLLSDVDGTLVTNDKVLTKAALAAVTDLRLAGIAVAITSSRPPRGLRMLIEPLGLEGPVAGLNGGIYVNPDLSVIQTYLLDSAVARQAVELMTASGLEIWLYTAKGWFVQNRAGPHAVREAWILKFPPKILALSDVELTQAIKIVGVSDEPERIAAAEQAVRRAVGDRASIARSQTYYLDVTDRQANKGAVVATLSRLMNIPTGQIAVIGDGSNDIAMFKAAGLSIAMGNASDEVKAEADAVTDTNENDGFAKAIRDFVLHPATA
jgi:Cof subfamily protein (haloacid dehalogenase superfamily)